MKIKRKKEKSARGKLLVGVAWYRPWQWDRLREIAAIPEEMPKTYANWLANAEEGGQHLRQSGFKPVKVDVDAEELLAWCQQRGLPVTGASRSSFVLEKVQTGQYMKE